MEWTVPNSERKTNAIRSPHRADAGSACRVARTNKHSVAAPFAITRISFAMCGLSRF